MIEKTIEQVIAEQDALIARLDVELQSEHEQSHEALRCLEKTQKLLAQAQKEATRLKILRLVGAQMANLCFNLSQESRTEPISIRDKETMKDLQRQWDAALRVDV